VRAKTNRNKRGEIKMIQSIKKYVLLRTSLVLGLCVGMILIPAVVASAPGYPTEVTGTVLQDDWILFATFDFEENYQVYMRLSIVDYVPYTDLDIYVIGPSEPIWIGGKGAEYYEDPSVAEQGYFVIPETGTHYVYIYGYDVPVSSGVDVVLYVDYGENLIDVVPLEPNGIKWGTLNSYVNSNGNAKYHASVNAAFRRGGEYANLVGSILTTREGFVNWLTAPSTPYELPPMRFCPSDNIGIGGLVWMLPAEGLDQEIAEWIFSYYYYKHYIDGIPLTELADIYDPSMDIIMDNGQMVYYVKMQETALFKSGDLANLIGYGRHILTSTIPSLGASFDCCFYILPEGTLMPDF
jgi:hypothetical protein